MAIISVVGAEEFRKQEKKENEDIGCYKIYFGVFFDGTSNNMIQGSMARKIRSNHASRGCSGMDKILKHGWIKDGRHKYENEMLEKEEEEQIENTIKKGSFKEGYTNYRGKDGGFSNIAILYSKYKGKKESDDTTDTKIIVYKIYVEGSGANDIKQWNTGWAAKGLGFGVAKTGVVALVSKAISAVLNQLEFIGDKYEGKVELHFDVFGFSRGAACARLFAHMVRRDNNDILTREYEFSKYYCKKWFEKGKEGKNRLSFLDKYEYVPNLDCSNDKKTGNKTKVVDFLGIFDTVVSIGMLRRKKDDNASNKFLDIKKNTINPLRAIFANDKDFNENLHDLNVTEYGMYSPQEGIPTFHICALDEFRENFALTDIGKNVNDKCLEIFIPGCHSDIGGGYICNNEEKIVINKYQTFSSQTGISHVFVKNPQGPLDSNNIEPLGINSIRKLGWLPKDTESDKKTKTFWLRHNKMLFSFDNEFKNKIQGENIKESDCGKYEWWDKETKIGWFRTVPSFFSNLPLHLMAEKASLVTTRKLFVDGTKYKGENENFWEEGYYEIPNGLTTFYEQVRNSIKKDCGREFIIPDNDYSSESYRKLRLFYLHFTAEQRFSLSRLWDVQNATNVLEKNNVISRIVYHGDKNEYDGHMFYMFDAYSK